MGRWIELTAADGHRLQAYQAEPTTAPRAAVIVAQEIFGVNSHIRAVTDGFAAAGYLAMAPALYDRVQRNFEVGYQAADIQAGRALKEQVSWEQALMDLSAARDAVKAAGPVGVVGYCWGGSVAWVAAARLEGIAASVPYYGGNIPGLIALQPRCPVMLQFGETDGSIPLDQARAVAAAHPEVTTHFYPAGHGFNCDQRGSFDATCAAQARERTLAFFAQHLG